MKETDYFLIFFLVAAAAMSLATVAFGWWSNELIRNRELISTRFGVHCVFVALLAIFTIGWSIYFSLLLDDKFGDGSKDLQAIDLLVAVLLFSLWATDLLLLVLYSIVLLGLHIFRRRAMSLQVKFGKKRVAS